VGARTIRIRNDSARRGKEKRQERLTLGKIIAALVTPMVLALVLVAMDIRIDLSELKSSGQRDEQGAIPLGWPDLEVSASQDGQRRVRMIGYMMDGYQPSRDGAEVNMFILLPEAGQFLHPAHRIPNQMVEIRPRHPIVFRYRDLVWASGVLNRTIGNPGDEKAAYAMSDAEVNRAMEREIGKWFRP
jgi:hypothetical protein